MFDCVHMMHTDAHAKMTLQAKKMFLIRPQKVAYELYLVCCEAIFPCAHTWCVVRRRAKDLRRYVCMCVCVCPGHIF